MQKPNVSNIKYGVIVCKDICYIAFRLYILKMYIWKWQKNGEAKILCARSSSYEYDRWSHMLFLFSAYKYMVDNVILTSYHCSSLTLALRSGSTIANEVHLRRGYC